MAVSHDRYRDMQLPRQDGSFDYRYGHRYRYVNKQPKHFADKSVFTFKGHAVYSTLIRCQFSPMETTGQRYVYTGSSDGNLHIYDLVTGDTAGVLSKAPPRRGDDMYGYGNASPARDISWHPFMPVLASTEFNGCVNIWSMQNIGEEERQKIEEQKSKQSKSVGAEYGNESEDSDGDGGIFGNQYVMVRGGNGQVYRVPVSLLRQIMNRDEDEEEQKQQTPAAEESKQEEEAESDEAEAEDDDEEDSVEAPAGDEDDADDWDLKDLSDDEEDDGVKEPEAVVADQPGALGAAAANEGSDSDDY